LLALSSCIFSTPTPDNRENGDTTPQKNNEAQNIQVSTVNAKKTDGTIEEFPLPNCGGTETLTQFLGTQASVSKSVEMGTTVSVSSGAEVELPEVAKLKIEAAIEAAYKQDYQTTRARIDSITMPAAPKTYVVYIVTWEKQEFSSIVTSELDNEVIKNSLHLHYECAQNYEQSRSTVSWNGNQSRETTFAPRHNSILFFNFLQYAKLGFSMATWHFARKHLYN
jgi:hypothetical protein